MATATIRLEPHGWLNWRMPLPSRTWRSSRHSLWRRSADTASFRRGPRSSMPLTPRRSRPCASSSWVKTRTTARAKPTASASPSSRRRRRRPRSATSTRNSIKTSGVPIPAHGDLSHWAAQGVLLLNTVLTVRAHEANSHRNRGWERFTDTVIARLNAGRDGLVFVLWGSAAGKKASMIDPQRHRILRSVHPSPLSAHRKLLRIGSLLGHQCPPPRTG